ncbi:MAG: DUF3592 domain-containing protein [Oscillospiraceae bacterium]|nr:DUF3592 domain-containing protein [Oscillospiraceae bacterium]
MIGFILFSLFGAGIIIYGFRSLAEIYSLKKNGTAIDATVLKTEIRDTRIKGFIFGETHNGNIYHYVAFSYTLDDTEYITRHETNDVSEEPCYTTGETVRIYCDKNNPHKIIISKEKGRTPAIVFGMIFGVLIVLFGIAGIVKNNIN